MTTIIPENNEAGLDTAPMSAVDPQSLMEEAVRDGATPDQAFDEAVAAGHDVVLCHRAHMQITSKIRLEQERQSNEATGN